MYLLGHEYRVFVNKISMFAQKNVSERIPLALLVLQQKFNEEGLLQQTLNFTRNDLATYVGTAPETLIRQLKILKDAGLISIIGRKIVIEDMNGLWQRANL
jgi:CRP/FNR family transcriptional regulator